MSTISYKMLQARGKVRRFIQSTFRPKRTAEMMSHRSGECNRCGACCKILFQCPFLFTDDDGQYSCRIYEKRFTQCRLYPIQAKDLREVPECSYTFDNAPDPAKSNTARDEAGRPEPVPAGK